MANQWWCHVHHRTIQIILVHKSNKLSQTKILEFLNSFYYSIQYWILYYMIINVISYKENFFKISPTIRLWWVFSDICMILFNDYMQFWFLLYYYTILFEKNILQQLCASELQISSSRNLGCVVTDVFLGNEAINFMKSSLKFLKI